MRNPVMAFSFDLGNVADAPVTRQVIVAYDEIYAITYLAGSCALLAAQRNQHRTHAAKCGARLPGVGPALRGI